MTLLLPCEVHPVGGAPAQQDGRQPAAAAAVRRLLPPQHGAVGAAAVALRHPVKSKERERELERRDISDRWHPDGGATFGGAFPRPPPTQKGAFPSLQESCCCGGGTEGTQLLFREKAQFVPYFIAALFGISFQCFPPSSFPPPPLSLSPPLPFQSAGRQQSHASW